MVSSALAVAPLRVSFVGGGSDIPNFFQHDEGAVISCAISKYVFVHVKIHDDSFGERYRISYSQVEHVQEISEIKNEIVRRCLEFMNIDFPVQISTLSDLPAGTGLGSSSSFTAALLLALHELKGERPTKYQLAEEACHVEISLLKHPIGKQDQYAAAYGGINLFRFRSDGRVLVEPICIASKELEEFLARCRLYWTSTERSAVKVLKDQASRATANHKNLEKMVGFAHEFKKQLECSSVNWREISSLIDKTWILKRELSPLISSSDIQEMITTIKSEGDYGIKLLGAGGGGFVLAFNGEESYKVPSNILSKTLSSSFVPAIDHLGARIISTF